MTPVRSIPELHRIKLVMRRSVAVIGMVPTISVCSSLSRKCRSHAAWQRRKQEAEQEDRMERLRKLQKFVTVSDKNLVKPFAQWAGRSVPDRPTIQLRGRHDFHRRVAEKALLGRLKRLHGKLAFFDRNR